MRYEEEGTIEVVAHFRHGDELVQEMQGQHKIRVRQFFVPPAKGTVGISRKQYLGNYNSVDVLVNVTKPCYSEEIHECLIECRNIALQHVGEIVTLFKQKAQS